MKKQLWLVGVCLSMLTGCSFPVSIVGRKGEEKVIQVGQQSISRAEVNIVLLEYETMYTQNYAAAFSNDFWNLDTGSGVLLKDYVKENVLWTELSQLTGLNELASEQKIELTQEEKEAAAQAGKVYFASLDEKQAEDLFITEASCISLLEKYKLAHILTEQMQQEADIEVSENEARVISVQQLQLDSKNEARKIYQEVSAGDSSWENIINGREVELVQATRGDYLPEIEDIIFSLDTGQLSEPIEVDGKYYLFYCVNAYLTGETEQNKMVLLSEYSYEAWSGATQELFEKKGIKLNRWVWNQVTFEYQQPGNAPTLRECFETYLVEE